MVNIKKFVETISYYDGLILLSLLSRGNLSKLKSELKDRYVKERQQFDKIVNGEVTTFGIPDTFNINGYFPCEFIEVIDEDAMNLVVCETSTGERQEVNIRELRIMEMW